VIKVVKAPRFLVEKHLESISPTNLRNAKRRQHKVNGTKRCSNISAEILLHVLGNSFCTERHILAHFCRMLLPLKASKISATKLLYFCTKIFDEIDPTGQHTNFWLTLNWPTVDATFCTGCVGKMSVGQLTLGQKTWNKLAKGFYFSIIC